MGREPGAPVRTQRRGPDDDHLDPDLGGPVPRLGDGPDRLRIRDLAGRGRGQPGESAPPRDLTPARVDDRGAASTNVAVISGRYIRAREHSANGRGAGAGGPETAREER